MHPLTRPLALAAAAAALAGPSRAESPASPPTQPPTEAAAPAPSSPKRPESRKAERLKNLDQNGDGTISPQERRAGAQAVRKKALERFDQDGDGQLSASERQAADADREARLLSRFDADGDGKLSEAERLAARPIPPKPATEPAGPANPKKRPNPKAQTDKPALRIEDRPSLMARFDTDRDGKLSDAERVAARRALRSARKPKPDR